MIKLSNKAFTLTELLMVVLMIGIISAMVLPKFTKVVDSFRALEAAEMMQAVRNDQEMRCTLGKKYTDVASKVKVFAKGRASGNKYNTSNFSYELQAGGMVARSPKGFDLEMPSYLDGRICCNACAELTKNYLTCFELRNLENFQKIKDNDPCKSS